MLDVFQRLACGWDEVYPYNAAQACLVAGSFDAGAIRRAFSRREIAPRVAAVDDHDLSRLFTSELNRPFGPPPIRLFARPTADGTATWVIVAYRHAFADGYFIRSLLARSIAKLVGAPAPPPERVARVECDATPGVGAGLDLLRRYGEYRRCRKVHTLGPLDHPVRVRILDPVRGVVPALLASARANGVKLSDVFVAALAEACSRFVPCQRRPGRHDLAVSSIVDLRPYLPTGERRRGGYGCHLGFTAAVCPARDLADWDRLLRRVASQHRPQRGRRRGPPGVLWMHAAALASRFSRSDRLYDFYRKEAPFVGGISNVNLNGTWVERFRAGGIVRDYVRVSPTGPMVPVVMNVTTLGDDLRLSMTYRANLFNDWTAAELAQQFCRRLERLGR